MSEEQNALAEKYGCNGNCATCTDVICALGGAGQIDKIDHPEPKPCPHCNGKGEHDSLPAPMFGERVKCAYCNGTGKQPAEPNVGEDKEKEIK